MITDKLGNHIEILSGFAFKSDRFNNDGKGLPLVRIRDVKPGYSETYYDGEFEDRYVLSDGDMLVGMDGEFNCARWSGGCALLNQRVCRIRAVSSKLDEQYLFWFLPKALKEIENRSNFVTVKHLSSKQINEIEIPLPPLEEQKRIATILDQADDIRRKRQHAIDRLNQLGQAIFHEMFGQMRKAPLQWPSVAFGEILKSAKIGLVRSSQEMGVEFGVPYLRMDAIQRNGQLELRGMKMTHATESERKTFNLAEGDFLFNTRNSKELVGKTGVVMSDLDAVYNNNILRVRFKDVADSLFIQAYFREPYAQQELEIRKSGTTSVFAIYQKSLETMPIPLPPIEMQRDFAKRVRNIFEISQKYFESQGVFLDLFSSLQHRAFTGQL